MKRPMTESDIAKLLENKKFPWNFVSERLPDDIKDYLVVDKDGNMGVGYYRKTLMPGITRALGGSKEIPRTSARVDSVK